MKHMVCDICQGKNLVKKNGKFECQDCGAKYTVDEARKLLVDDNGERTSNNGTALRYLELANQAAEAGAFFEAETYCDKALGLDAANYPAWRLKARVVCLQTNGLEDRTREGIALYIKALELSPEDRKEELRMEALINVTDAIRCHVFAIAKKYSDSVTTDTAKELGMQPFYVADRTAMLKEAISIDVLDVGLKKQVGMAMSTAAVEAWYNKILPEYDAHEHRGKLEMDAFVDRGDTAVDMIKKSLRFYQDNSEDDVSRHRNIVSMQEQLISAHSMRQVGRKWVREYSLSDENKIARREDIAYSQQAIKAIDPTYVMKSPAREFDELHKARSKPSVWNRAVNWRLVVAIFCIIRFINLSSTVRGLQSPEQFLWIGLGIVFAVWWYLAI